LNCLNPHFSPGRCIVYVQYADALPRVSPTYTNTITYVISIDTDNDGIPDTNDNCTLVINPAQIDSDGDRFGNYCDPGFDNSGVVNAADLSIVMTMFFKPPGPSCRSDVLP